MDLTKFKHKTFLEGNIILINADCLDVMREIRDKTFNLIISDGPYFKVCGKFDWVFKTMQEWIDWHILLRDEFERIMADNGSLFVFGDEKNIAYLQVEFDKKFNLLNSIIYRKVNAMTVKGLDGFNSFPPITERILFYDKGENKTGLEMIKKDINLFIDLKNYSRNIREYIDYSRQKMIKILGHGGSQHFLEPDGPQWDLSTKETYEQLIKLFNIDNMINFREYEDLRKEYEDLRKEYEDLRRPFNNEFRLTDVIDAKLKSSFHPTTKDGAVIEKLILTTTKENDLVFSPFLGSGTDALACIRTKRRLIACELDPIYFEKAVERVEAELRQGVLF